MTAKSADWKSWKKLGVAKVTDDGRLIMVYGVPKSKEIFTVREMETLAPDGMRYARLSINSFYPHIGEMMHSFADYFETKDEVYIRNLRTAKGRFGKRGMASALVSYLKSKKLPIRMNATKASKDFCMKLGFSRVRPHSAQMELPAGKPLKTREFEKAKRKFVIFEKPRRRG